VGIAGPGDTLATDHALETFRLVHSAYPHLINCLSTNGLLLADKAGALIEAGVQTVTVTVNAVNPALQAQISRSILYRGQRLTGLEGARRLIANQLDGIRAVARLGVAVKVNTVLIPGINDDHVGSVAEAVAAAGASLINIIPLIPQHRFADLAPPDHRQVLAARRQASEHLPVFAHCQRCRADACGIPGISDFADKLYGAGAATQTFSHG
jgi:nitrogen fixation protein NifB